MKMYVKLTLLITCSLLFCSATNLIKYEYLKTVERGFKEYLETKVRPSYLNEALSHLQTPHIFRDNEKFDKVLHGFEDELLCRLCNIVANFVVDERKQGMDNIQIKAEVTNLCEIFHIEDKRVCAGTIDMNADVILYIIDHNPDIPAAKFCDIMLQEFKCNYTNIDWAIDVPEGQTPSRSQPGASPSTYKILHVTDVHMDPLYTPKKVKSCDEPLCCQADQADGYAGNSCGYWTDYGNDVSENLIDEMIRFGNSLDIDFVYFTGDIISHRVWSTTQANNTDTITRYFQKLKSGFSVPVFPILGNHEPSPLNQFAYGGSIPSNLSTRWLFDVIEKDWAQWIPESAMDTIAKGGFYTVSPKEGFRLIVLNNNVAYRACWWLLENDNDPYHQLDWLTSILSQAESKNESVHILGHVPTGSLDLLKVWEREYNKIVNRFANTITGQFNGHVHVDTFQLYYNTSDPLQAINVAWNGASLVPYNQANPSFKVYSVDKETFNIVDIDQWTFNLTQANENSEKYPEWYKIYTFRDAFGTPTVLPKDMGNLLVNMATNHSLLGDYHLYRYKNSPFAIENGCDQDCQKGYLCEFSTSVYGDTTQCNYLKEVYDKNLLV